MGEAEIKSGCGSPGMSRRQPSRDSDLGGWVSQGDPRRYGRRCGEKYQQGRSHEHSSIRETTKQGDAKESGESKHFHTSQAPGASECSGVSQC